MRRNLIPADVRRFHVRRQRAHLLGEKSEARVSRRFFARREHRLQSQANSQNRHARLDMPSRSDAGQIPFAQARDERREMSHARAARWLLPRPAARGSTARSVSAPSPQQRALDRRQIPRAVIDDRDFHSSPFVEGSTRRSCLSRVTANRSAFANALKIDST